MKSVGLGQNFLQNRRTARRLAHLAGGPLDALCIDLGAGNGAVTAAAVSVREGPVWAVEYDPRLAAVLRTRFADDPSVEVIQADLLTVELPTTPFVIAANPPFNTSTKLVRRWMVTERFISAALIVERSFGRRISGDFGSTKLSLSLLPFLDIGLPFDVRADEFTPRPRVPTAILTATRVPEPRIPSSERDRYWRFVNYLFERSRATVGEAIHTLKLPAAPRSVTGKAVADLSVSDVIQLFELSTQHDSADREIAAFHSRLPAARRPLATARSVKR